MKKTILIACIVALVTLTAGPAFGQESNWCSEFMDQLPDDVLVKILYANPTLPGLSYFEEVTIQFPCPGDTPAPTIIDGVHEGWCLDPATGITSGTRYLGIPYASHLALPTSLTDLWLTPENMPMVNWLMNNTHLIGTASLCDGNFTYGDFQNTMWALLVGYIIEDGEPGSYLLGDFDVCRIEELYDMAMLHGDFEPNCGDFIGIILDTYYVGICPDLDGTVIHRQPVLFPFLCECEGCTPGFWKNNADKHNANAWVGYSPGDDFSDTFSIPEQVLRDKGKKLFLDPTLLQALNANGDGIDKLARHATAALLNITNGCVNDAIGSEADLIQMVQDAVAAGVEAIDALAIKIAGYNDTACPLNQDGECDD